MSRAYDEVRVIVAFGDIRGFSAFAEAVNHIRTELIPFLKRYDVVIDEHRGKSGLDLSDEPGDGVRVIIELGEGHNCDVAIRLLKTLWAVSKGVAKVIQGTKYPRPDGFRVRVAAGHVVKTVKADGAVVYRGKHINMANKILRVEPEIPVICHETVKELISEPQARAAGFRFTKLENPRPTPESVQRKDMNALWKLEVRRGRSR